MTIQRGFAFDHGKAVRGNTPSSCDGAGCESQFDPNTGQRIPGYVAPTPPARLGTAGALGDQTAHNDPSLAEWQSRAKQPGLGVGISGDGADGITVGGE